ncbi:MAG: hypothetical protein Q8R35_03020 [bacterium]|nr:hypothetical protein [bacterium]
MRKRFKRKQHSCGLCKPQKVGWETRWKQRDFVRLREFEKERRMLVG